MATEDQCTACGERNPAGSAFCLFCGAYLGWDEPGRGPAASSPPVDVVLPTPAAGAPPPAPEDPVRPVASPPTGGCPACGQPNDSTRRFCSRCGTPLAAAAPTFAVAPHPVSAASPGRPWWSLGDLEGRRARREYRRSLPPLYRWRRVIVAVVSVVGITVLLTAVGRDPVGWARHRWYDVTGKTEVIDGVTARADPVGSVAPPFDAAGVVDGFTEDAWATQWPENTATPADCREDNGVGRIVLVLTEGTRVRGLDIWTSVKGAGERQRQFRPRRLDVRFGGQCISYDLKDQAGRQRVDFDTGVEVDSITVAVASAFPPDANPAKQLVAIGRIELLRRPG